MGYQESFIYCKDFRYMKDIVNNLGKQWFEERDVHVVEEVTLDNNLSFNLDWMCKPEITKDFKAGDRFLWIVGDRSHQRSTGCLFGNNTDKDKKMEIYFIECMSDQLFNGQEWLFSAKDFKYDEDVQTLERTY